MKTFLRSSAGLKSSGTWEIGDRLTMGIQKSLNFTEHFGRLIEEQVRDGRFESEVEVVQAGLQLLEQRERKLAAFRAAIDEGEASGGFHEIDWGDLFEEVEAEERGARDTKD
ncbi:type II toxin-antitoxin system ParD family antitoxin [Aurantimonas sp. VKM B-3413]|uniref:type II toxin-antitoxin system ParD family antitoxin n=1 Tax=Aurantimonas sp. VKM B-3413 TaxID=2779401 RepID=UPI001E4791EC|nr:type II toxin-antitoxin system ParD family antitoxin [Aurantimonas sp. VKM B-3413]MCB8839198.1 type II toxin-antitoxin system ParD family antitoxin [Aurantimonas sp. VKM B-3413]